MRKMLVAAVAMALVSVAPAGADHGLNKQHNFTMEALVPCMAACAYWLDDANTDIDGDGKDEIYFDACRAPAPQGSWDDLVVTAPTGAGLLVFEIFPPLDWDSFICESGDTDGDGKRNEQLASGANAVGDACDGLLGASDPTGTGCAEKAQISVKPGRKYILRAYNWQDLPTLQARYTWKTL